MTWIDALEVLKDHPHIEQFRRLCGDGNPDIVVREAWKAKVIRLASGDTKPQYPPMTQQAGSLLGAVVRAGTALATGQEVMRSAEEQEACLAICAGCAYFVEAEGRCSICGCVMVFKSKLKQEHCPLPVPKW